MWIQICIPNTARYLTRNNSVTILALVLGTISGTKPVSVLVTKPPTLRYQCCRSRIDKYQDPGSRINIPDPDPDPTCIAAIPLSTQKWMTSY
jgi:hypothetical protein